MSQILAVAGKGGVGKTTLAALLIRALSREGGPVLAVDADPNSNLAVSIGLNPEDTLGGVLEEFNRSKVNIPQGMPKHSYLELRLNQSVVESRGIDMITMGRGEGPGCYCTVNAILRDFLEKLSDNYPWVVIDNEAGMEHLSRNTATRINDLMVVSDPSIKGIRTVRNLLELVNELHLNIDRMSLVIARAGSLDPRVSSLMKELPIRYLGFIPEDPLILEADLEEKSLLQLPDDSPSVRAVDEIIKEIKQGGKKPWLQEDNKKVAERG
jgi:CO dehydrogenase maturation factor